MSCCPPQIPHGLAWDSTPEPWQGITLDVQTGYIPHITHTLQLISKMNECIISSELNNKQNTQPAKLVLQARPLHMCKCGPFYPSGK